LIRSDRIVKADCIKWMKDQPAGSVDLVFADPPFNIGFAYDLYHDNRKYREYYEWTGQWMAEAERLLKSTGSFWIAIGTEYAAEVRMLGRELGLTLRNWIPWYYTFGQNAKAKFARSHTHLFYFVKDPKVFTFNDAAVRTFSDRQRVYNDRRANKAGKIPDDVWMEFSRLCGTFGEREGWHPCQMPEPVLARIVRVSSNVGELVFDPFGGSGTTLVAAKRSGRRYLGTEMSANYVENIEARLADTRSLADALAQTKGPWPAEMEAELQSMYAEAALPTEKLLASDYLRECFVAMFNGRLATAGVERAYSEAEVWEKLDQLRAEARLPKIRVHADEPTGPRRGLDGTPRPRPRRRRRDKLSAGGTDRKLLGRFEGSAGEQVRE
jgi:site-specific DNA-methyltransferase (adenine-specific)